MQPQNMKVLVFGQNVWGKGDTLTEALANAYKPKSYMVYIVHPDSYVDDMGYIVHPKGCPAKEIHCHRIPKQKK